MKYKEGDIVRVKSLDWYNSTRDSNGWINLNGFKFNPDMKKFCGKTFTIKTIWLDYYEFERNEYAWTDDMIEGLASETDDSKITHKMKYKVGDKVKIKSLKWYNDCLSIPNKIVYRNELTNDIIGIWCGTDIFSKEMCQYCGKTMTIKEFGHACYFMDEDNQGFIFTDKMIEGKVDDCVVKPKYNLGDMVGVYDYETDVKIIEIQSEGKGCFKYKVFLDNEEKWVYEDDIAYRVGDEEKKDMGEVSDGYHTFNELYEYRILYNASMFNELAKQGLYDVHKSKRHSDGEIPFGNSNLFIVMAELPTGQISNHYEMKDWDLFQIPEKEKANKWDGHTPKDVVERIRKFLTPKPKYPKTYEECCVVLEYIPYTDDVIGYKWNILQLLQKLLICRDAYWKIAGEEMGLKKPWEPDWKSIDKKYNIYNYRGVISYDYFTVIDRCILAFPTEEIRDAFYNNFKDLIEQCKELL